VPRSRVAITVIHDKKPSKDFHKYNPLGTTVTTHGLLDKPPCPSRKWWEFCMQRPSFQKRKQPWSKLGCMTSTNSVLYPVISFIEIMYILTTRTVEASSTSQTSQLLHALSLRQGIATCRSYIDRVQVKTECVVYV
jgi:hypothetical protein